MITEKKCKGKNKASGYIGCGKTTPVSRLKYGLCPSCLMNFYFDTDKGRVIYEKSFLPKVKKATESREKEKTKKAKEKIINWNTKLQSKINEIVRIIDNGLPCLARGTYPKQMHAGHVYARGGNQSIRFNLHNIHRQSAQSNHFQNDDGLLREGLITEYGNEYMQFISNLRRTEPLKYKNEEYHDLYKKACEIANKLRKTVNKPIPIEYRIESRNSVNIELGIYNEEYCIFKK